MNTHQVNSSLLIFKTFCTHLIPFRLSIKAIALLTISSFGINKQNTKMNPSRRNDWKSRLISQSAQLGSADFQMQTARLLRNRKRNAAGDVSWCRVASERSSDWPLGWPFPGFDSAFTAVASGYTGNKI